MYVRLFIGVGRKKISNINNITVFLLSGPGFYIAL